MADFEKEVLNKLLDQYECSVLSTVGSKKDIKIKLTTKNKELSTYVRPDSYNYRVSNDTILHKLEKKGFIIVKWDKNEYFESLILNIENVGAVYSYLRRQNPKDEISKVKQVLSNDNYSGFIAEFIEFCQEYIANKYAYPKRYFDDANQLESILKGLKAIVELQQETMIRDFSVKVYGDSKAFEKIKGKAAKIIKDFDAQCNAESDDDILAEYNIVKNSTYVLIKNAFVFKLNNATIDLDSLGFEYALSDEMIKALVPIKISAERVITVENLTSFYGLQDSKALIIYLGGYHNHTKNMLLQRIKNIFPKGEYYHFGDIDAGGFYILNHLKEATGIPFKPYKMGIVELETKSGYLKKLTDNDKRRLGLMKQDNRFIEFWDIIEYMLGHNVKLEQEILD